MYTCDKFKTGDGKGERFEVVYRPSEGEAEEAFGWADVEGAARAMLSSISKHPEWKGGRIIDRIKERSTCEECGRWHCRLPHHHLCNSCAWDKSEVRIMAEPTFTPRWLTLKQAVAYSGLCANTLRKYSDECLIATSRTDGGHRRFDRESIDAYFQRDEVDTLAIRKVIGL